MTLDKIRKKIHKYSYEQFEALEVKLSGVQSVSNELMEYVALSASKGYSYDSLAGRLGISVETLNKLMNDSRMLFNCYVLGAQLYISNLEGQVATYMTAESSSIGESTRVKMVDQLNKLCSKAKQELNALIAKYENGDMQGADNVDTGRGGQVFEMKKW